MIKNILQTNIILQYNFKTFNKTRANKPSSDRNQEAEECKTKLEQTKTVQYTNT